MVWDLSFLFICLSLLLFFWWSFVFSFVCSSVLCVDILMSCSWLMIWRLLSGVIDLV